MKKTTLNKIFLLVMVFSLLLPVYATGQTTSITLAWQPNSEPDLAGYRVYYNTNGPGPPYDGVGLIEGDSPITIDLNQGGFDKDNPEYTLTGLDPDTNYWFVLTAFDFDQNESGYSNEVTTALDSSTNLADLYCVTYSDGTNDDRFEIQGNDPAEASVMSVFDEEKQSNVIELSDFGYHDFRLKAPNGYRWDNVDQRILRIDLKTLSCGLRMYVEVETTEGRKYLKYIFENFDRLGSYDYIEFGLGLDKADGTWHTFQRDLVADLKTAQPNVDILSVGGKFFRDVGESTRVDDVILDYNQ